MAARGRPLPTAAPKMPGKSGCASEGAYGGAGGGEEEASGLAAVATKMGWDEGTRGSNLDACRVPLDAVTYLQAGRKQRAADDSSRQQQSQCASV